MTSASVFHAALWWSVVIAVAYVLAANLLVAVRCAVASRGRLPDFAPEEQSALALSRFTIPVSVIVHVEDDQHNLIPSVRALLELDYPQFEVIAVVDGARTLDALKREFTLVPRQMFYRRSLSGPDVRAIYASSLDARLLVVDQPATDAAVAWNCGINLARYRYVGIVAAGRFCRADALLTAMAPANADPASVVAILGDLGAPDRRTTPRPASGDVEASRVQFRVSGFEELERLREEAARRVAPVDLRGTLDNPEAFGLWRRDAVVEAGGFSAGGAGAGLDLALRLHRPPEGPAYRILTMARARRPGSDQTVRETIRKRARWCRAMLEAAFRTHGRVLSTGRGRARLGGLATLLPGLLEAWLLIALPIGALAGAFGWLPAIVTAATVALAKGVASNVALLLAASVPASNLQRPLRSIFLGVLEFPVYRPVALIAAVEGSRQFLTGRSPVPPADPV